MIWKEYYEKWMDCESVREIIRYLPQLDSIGSEDEVAEVIMDLGNESKAAGTQLLRKALSAGLTFTGENLWYMEGNCTDEVWLQAVQLSAKNFTTADLDELLYTLDDKVLMAIAEKYHLALPQEMLDDMAEEQDGERAASYEADPITQEYDEVRDNLAYLIRQADHALECLRRAYEYLTYAVVNRVQEGNSQRNGRWSHRYWSHQKYEYADQANAQLEAAEEALSHLGVELQQWVTGRGQRIHVTGWQRTMDIWSKHSLSGAINSEKIRRAWRQVEQTIPQVEALRDELQSTYEELTKTYQRYEDRKKRR